VRRLELQLKHLDVRRQLRELDARRPISAVSPCIITNGIYLWTTRKHRPVTAVHRLAHSIDSGSRAGLGRCLALPTASGPHCDHENDCVCASAAVEFCHSREPTLHSDKISMVDRQPRQCCPTALRRSGAARPRVSDTDEWSLRILCAPHWDGGLIGDQARQALEQLKPTVTESTRVLRPRAPTCAHTDARTHARTHTRAHSTHTDARTQTHAGAQIEPPVHTHALTHTRACGSGGCGSP
jgi:hypothetical protein